MTFRFFSPKEKKKRLFLDYASITPIDERVLKVVHDAHQYFQNPSSIHKDGVKAKELIEEARKKVASFFRAHQDEVIFTASGTESCVMAIRGVVSEARKKIGRPHIIISAIEHPAISETVTLLEEEGVEVSVLPVDENGLVQIAVLKELIKEETILVSIQMVNSEVGTIEPIRDISLYIQKIKKEKTFVKNENTYPLLHTDASQAICFEDIDLRKIHADLLTADSIKCYGPRGMGLLFKRRNVKISPVITGGGQEFGLRSGTENLPGILGFAKALEIAEVIRVGEGERLADIKKYAAERITALISKCEINGSIETSSPHILNICFKDADAEFVVLSLDALDISCSYASACKSLHGDATSLVISALGKEKCAGSSVRFSFGRSTTRKSIDRLIEVLTELMHRGVIK